MKTKTQIDSTSDHSEHSIKQMFRLIVNGCWRNNVRMTFVRRSKWFYSPEDAIKKASLPKYIPDIYNDAWVENLSGHIVAESNSLYKQSGNGVEAWHTRLELKQYCV